MLKPQVTSTYKGPCQKPGLHVWTVGLHNSRIVWSSPCLQMCSAWSLTQEIQARLPPWTVAHVRCHSEKAKGLLYKKKKFTKLHTDLLKWDLDSALILQKEPQHEADFMVFKHVNGPDMMILFPIIKVWRKTHNQPIVHFSPPHLSVLQANMIELLC